MTDPTASFDNDLDASDVTPLPDTSDGTDLPDFGMTTDAGNVAVDDLVRRVAALVGSGEVERREAVEVLSDGLRAVAAGHVEATDVTVRDAILRELHPVFAGAGWQVLEPFEF